MSCRRRAGLRLQRTAAMFKKEYASGPIALPRWLTSNSIHPGSKTKVKSSAQRAIRAQIAETYPALEPFMDDIMPKKEQLDMVKLCVPQHRLGGPAVLPARRVEKLMARRQTRPRRALRARPHAALLPAQ